MYYRYLFEKVTSTDVRITNISQSLPHKMAETADMKKLRHCHPIMYTPTLRDLMTITFDLLNLAGDHTRGHVINPPPSLPSLRILYSCALLVLKRDVKLPLTQLCSCVLEYIASSILLLLTARLRPLHMRRTRHHLCRGHIFHICETRDPDCSIHFATYVALRSRQIELSAKLLYGRV